MENTGNGEGAAVRDDNRGTAGSLRSSRRSGGASIRKTASLTLGERLEILQQSVLDYQLAGGRAQIEAVRAEGVGYTVIILNGVDLVECETGRGRKGLRLKLRDDNDDGCF